VGEKFTLVRVKGAEGARPEEKRGAESIQNADPTTSSAGKKGLRPKGGTGGRTVQGSFQVKKKVASFLGKSHNITRGCETKAPEEKKKKRHLDKASAGQVVGGKRNQKRRGGGASRRGGGGELSLKREG